MQVLLNCCPRRKRLGYTKLLTNRLQTVRFLAIGLALTSVSAAFFLMAGSVLTVGLREEACQLFLIAVMNTLTLAPFDPLH